MSKHPLHEQQRHEWLAEELRAPEVRARCKASKDTSEFSPSEETDLLFLSNEKVVTQWIEAGADLNDLPRLLQERPELLDVGLIREQLYHLHTLASGFMPAADFLGGLAADKETAAQAHLKRLTEAIVRSLLPGYSAQITKAMPNGRPKEMEYEELLQDLKGLLRSFDLLLEKNPLVLIRQLQESQRDFTNRIALFVQHLYQKSHLSFSASISPEEPFLDAEGQPAINMDSRLLDLPAALRIAHRAIQKRKSASFKGLVLGVLQYHYHLTPKALENHVSRLKTQYPDGFKSLCDRYPRFRRS